MPEIDNRIYYSIIIVVITMLALLVNHWIFKKIKFANQWTGPVKMILTILIAITGLVVFVSSLKLDNKQEIFQYITLIVTAGIALSSTTILGNLIAGLVNNSMGRFRLGDLIKIGEVHQGIVTKKNAFNIEIQLEDSNFITIPNLYVINNPVKLTRKTETLISTSVSLGYDVSREKIEKALKEAATAANLDKAFVYVTELGDFSVVYKIHGFLDKNSTFMSTKSQLNIHVMDKLHENNIEIVSPTFMNQRRADDKNFLPTKTVKIIEDPPPPAEGDIFDTGELSRKKEELNDDKSKLKNELQELKNSLNSNESSRNRKILKAKINEIENEINTIETEIQILESKIEEIEERAK